MNWILVYIKIIDPCGQRTMISLYDQQEEKVYVFNRKGNLMPPFQSTALVLLRSTAIESVFLQQQVKKKRGSYQIPQGNAISLKSLRTVFESGE